MAALIDEVKNRVHNDFLGKEGIHGVGVSRAQNAIRVYVSSSSALDRSKLLEQLRKSAEPFSVILVEEERPRMR